MVVSFVVRLAISSTVPPGPNRQTPVGSREGRYAGVMVTLELQEALSRLNLAERLDVIDLLQQSLVVPPVVLDESQVEMIQQRDAEMDADPSIGLTWDEVRSRLLRR